MAVFKECYTTTVAYLVEGIGVLTQTIEKRTPEDTQNILAETFQRIGAKGYQILDQKKEDVKLAKIITVDFKKGE